MSTSDPTRESTSPHYGKVFLTFARNSLVRDMTFRTNFIIEAISSLSWNLMNFGFYILIFSYTDQIEGWNQHQFFVFLATFYFINSLVQTFFMPNFEEFSELIRTGGLDFALLKPIDTQFLVSLNRIEWSDLGTLLFGVLLMIYALPNVDPGSPGLHISLVQMVLYPIYILCGVAVMYSFMLSLAATSVWLGRNQTLYNFWFYITNFARYPMEIYGGNAGGIALRQFFTLVIPILVVVNVPAQLMAKPLQAQNWPLVIFGLSATILSLLASRWIFRRSLLSYRSASS